MRRALGSLCFKQDGVAFWRCATQVFETLSYEYRKIDQSSQLLGSDPEVPSSQLSTTFRLPLELRREGQLN